MADPIECTPEELADMRAELHMLRNQIKGYDAGRQVENERLGEAVYYCGLSVFYAVLGLKWVLKARRWWRE